MWDESQCNRDDDGKFAEKGSGGYSKEQLDRARQELNRLVNGYKSRVNLSKVEWKKFYNKIAEVQHGGYAEKLSNGNVIVCIEDNNIHTVVAYNGDFVDPKVYKTIKVKDEKSMTIKGIMDYLKEYYE